MSLNRLKDVFDGLGGEAADPAISMPAALPLELSGETVRPRLCIFPGPAGSEYALRADFTLPLAQVEAGRRRTGDTAARTYVYDGPVFRLPSRQGEAIEFRQVGLEQYGGEAPEDANRRTLSVLLEGVAAAGLSGLTLRIGDLTLVPSVIDALGLSPEASNALKRAFRQPGGMSALLMSVGDPSHRLAKRLSALPESDARALIEETMAVAGITAIGTRGIDEVVERLVSQGAGTLSTQIPEEARAVLSELAEIRVPAAEAAETLNAFLARSNLVLNGDLVDRIATRHAIIPDDVSAEFTPIFGRQFTYYDGFVFDIFKDDACLGGGGRYDSLLSHLTEGDVTAPAIGGALRIDRIEAQIGGMS